MLGAEGIECGKGGAHIGGGAAFGDEAEDDAGEGLGAVFPGLESVVGFVGEGDSFHASCMHDSTKKAGLC